MQNEHQTVLLTEAINGLAIQADGVYVDGTFGRGGHSQVILNKLSERGRLIAIDKDPRAVKIARERFGKDKRFVIWHGAFSELSKLAKHYEIVGGIDGILLDVGVSTPQFTDPERGFSFLRDGPLDMRMNPEKGLDAGTWLNQVGESELAYVLRAYGEERYARRIAKAIVSARTEAPVQTTRQLAEIVSKANPSREKHKHPATRTFQAIRIAINSELEELETTLDQALEVLKVGGRLVVISFHSLEDRIVKSFVKRHEKGDWWPAKLPIKQTDLQPRLQSMGKPIRPRPAEIDKNIHARSAILRIAEKLA